MAFQEHLQQEIAFHRFNEEQQQQLSEANRDMHQQQQRVVPPTWLNNNNVNSNNNHLRQQNFLHQLQPDTTEKTAMDRNRNDGGNYESDDLRDCKADILGHPLYEQLLSAHVSCLRIATPVDQLPRIDAQLQQSQRSSKSTLQLDQTVSSMRRSLITSCTTRRILLLLRKFDQKTEESHFGAPPVPLARAATGHWSHLLAPPTAPYRR